MLEIGEETLRQGKLLRSQYLSEISAPAVHLKQLSESESITPIDLSRAPTFPTYITLITLTYHGCGLDSLMVKLTI